MYILSQLNPVYLLFKICLKIIFRSTCSSYKRCVPFGFQITILYTFRSVFSFTKSLFSFPLLYCRVPRFSKNLKATLKFHVTAGWYEANSMLRMQCVCACVSCRSRPVLLITSKEFDLLFYQTYYGHGAIQGYQHLVTPLITVGSPREFEQFGRFCSCRKCSYYASTYIPASPALSRAVRHRLLPAEELFRAQFRPYGIYGGLSGIGRGFASGASLFLYQCHFTGAPQHIRLSLTQYV